MTLSADVFAPISRQQVSILVTKKIKVLRFASFKRFQCLENVILGPRVTLIKPLKLKLTTT